MAMILDFRSGAVRLELREEPRGDGLEVARGGGAEIIIFPGVRRERHAETAKPRRRDKGRPKRDRLELPD